ncbi:Cysteine-rich DPF motif domain-containing protein 1 [Sergentomyia squamirostris]
MSLARIPLRRFSSVRNSKFFIEKLKNRALIRVAGDESGEFLQGLITNDIRHLEQHGATGMFAMVLNKAGRVLYDTLIYRKTENSFLIECDKDVCAELRKHLMIFRVRKKIAIDSLETNMNVWVVFKCQEEGEDLKLKNDFPEYTVCQDPRLKDLGHRILTPKEILPEQIFSSLKDGSHVEDCYRGHRYALGVGEGITELPPGKSFPLEANCDYLHGLSVHKGCYLGQEFTARTYHTGVVRKRLMPLTISSEILDKPDINVESGDGKNLGKLRGVAGNVGLGLLRIEPALAAEKILIEGMEVTTKKPSWWPQELPREKQSQ